MTKDIWDHFDERDRKRAARSPLAAAWEAIGWSIYRAWDHHLRPRALWWTVVAFFQRRRRGFDDSELWSLDSTVLVFILPRLKRFRAKERWGWPGPEAIFDIDYEDFEKLSEEEVADLSARSIEEWDRMLDKMIRAIELQIGHAGIFQKLNPEWKEGDSRRHKFIDSPEMKAEYEEGWALFIRWFQALWD